MGAHRVANHRIMRAETFAKNRILGKVNLAGFRGQTDAV
jgi:hypothetical protein